MDKSSKKNCQKRFVREKGFLSIILDGKNFIGKKNPLKMTFIEWWKKLLVWISNKHAVRIFDELSNALSNRIFDRLFGDISNDFFGKVSKFYFFIFLNFLYFIFNKIKLLVIIHVILKFKYLNLYEWNKNISYLN